MRAIIYGFNPQTKEWEELLNKGQRWMKMNGMTFMLWHTMRLSKKHKMRTYISIEKEEGKIALLPIKFNLEVGLFFNYTNEYVQASEWRLRKTIPEIEITEGKQDYWTMKRQFEVPTILQLKFIDIFIEKWEKFKQKNIKTVSDFIINAVTKVGGEEVYVEADLILSDPKIFEEFYKEIEPLGIKKEKFEVASKKYSNFLKKEAKKENKNT